jgi:hypothetical protein
MTEAEQIMKRCQAGTRNYNEANNLHAACYGMIGKLLIKLNELESQEPVAWMTINEYGEEDDIHYENPEGHLLEGWTYKPLYTHPPTVQPEKEPAKDKLDFWALFDENQRLRAELKFNATPPQQWVGLTNEEIKSLPNWWPSYEDSLAFVQLVKDVEAKLKEKNT